MEIKRGDVIKIRALGLVRQGLVISAQQYSDGWYIEYTDPEWGYGYWKQPQDGGRVELIEKGPHIPTVEEDIKTWRDEARNIYGLIGKLREQFPDADIDGGVFGTCDLYDSYSWVFNTHYSPPVTIYLFLLWHEGKSSSVMLINEEATEMDKFLRQVPVPH